MELWYSWYVSSHTGQPGFQTASRETASFAETLADIHLRHVAEVTAKGSLIGGLVGWGG